MPLRCLLEALDDLVKLLNLAAKVLVFPLESSDPIPELVIGGCP